jgi:hypothetical protein
MTHPFADQRFDSAKVAMAELKSKHGSHSDDSHLIPVGSNVKLYRDQNKLEIVFEKKRKKQITTVIVIFLFFGMIFAGGAIILALLMIGILIKVIPIIINIINPNLNASTFYKIISINMNSTIRIGLGFADDISEPKQWQNSSFINLLVYNAGYTFDNYLNDRGSVVNQTVTIQPKLFMYSEHGIEYEVGDDEYQLSQGELLWLGQEISDFLGIEMKVIYPTPKVPPEISCGGC